MSFRYFLCHLVTQLINTRSFNLEKKFDFFSPAYLHHLKIQYHIFIFFLSFPFLCSSCQHLRSPRDYLLLHFSTRRFSRFFLYRMYLSLDPFTQLSIYVYRFTSVFLPTLYSLSTHLSP